MPRAGMERPPFNHRIISTDHKDLQNITTSNEFHDTAIQMQSFHSSFNSDYQGKDAFQLERNAGRSKATGHDWSMYSQRFYNHDNLYHGEILDDYSPDYSPSLDNVSWGSSSRRLDNLRLPWVHDDGEFLPRYPLSPSPTPPRIPCSVVAVRPQHARTYHGFWTQDEQDGSYEGSSFRSCGQEDTQSWTPPPRLAPPPALDPPAAPRRPGDRLHRTWTSAPEIHAATPGVGSSGRPRSMRGQVDHKQPTLAAAKRTGRAGPSLQAGGALQIDSDVLALPPPPPQLQNASSPTIAEADGAAAEMRPSANRALRPAIRVRGRVRRTRSAEAATAPDQAALRTAFGEMVRGHRDGARSWLRARALALAGGGGGPESEGYQHRGPGTEAGAAGAAGVAAVRAVPRATSAGGRAEHSAPTSGKGEHGYDGNGGGEARWQLQAPVTGAWTRNAAELAPTRRRPAEQDEEQEEEDKADPPPCGCMLFGRPAAPSVAGRGGAGAGTLLGRAARRLSAAVRG